MNVIQDSEAKEGSVRVRRLPSCVLLKVTGEGSSISAQLEDEPAIEVAMALITAASDSVTGCNLVDALRMQGASIDDGLRLLRDLMEAAKQAIVQIHKEGL